MPGIIGERVFSVFDRHKIGYVNNKEFIETALRLLSPQFDENIHIVFEIYDFDNDGYISREEIRTLLSYVPLKEILSKQKNEESKEGVFTKSGGGL